jgi:large subunit ribosomal protein L23
MSTIFQILLRPIVTEKTNFQSTSLHQYTFEVALNATRKQVKEAIEQIYKVNVLNVNMINVPAKQSRRGRSRRMAVRNAGYKKAIITLAAEDRLPIFEGVE